MISHVPHKAEFIDREFEVAGTGHKEEQISDAIEDFFDGDNFLSFFYQLYFCVVQALDPVVHQALNSNLPSSRVSLIEEGLTDTNPIKHINAVNNAEIQIFKELTVKFLIFNHILSSPIFSYHHLNFYCEALPPIVHI